LGKNCEIFSATNSETARRWQAVPARSDERTFVTPHATHLRVQVDSSEHGTAVDVSRGGIFITTRRPLPIGSELSLHLEAPGSDTSLYLSGSVVRIATGGELAARAAMAIMFEDLERSQREAFKLLIEELADSQPPSPPK
jgi:Tfp pilus assembly protein PilZ